jgi:hypothetical protein
MKQKLVLVTKILLLCAACLALAAGIVYLLRPWLEPM